MPSALVSAYSEIGTSYSSISSIVIFSSKTGTNSIPIELNISLTVSISRNPSNLRIKIGKNKRKYQFHGAIKEY